MPTPLHPAMVHLPLGMALLLPLAALAALFAATRGHSRVPWAAFVGVAALALAGGYVAMRTGEAEEGRVERVVGEAALEQHEALAKQFMAVTTVALVLGMAAGALIRRRGATVALGTLALLAGMGAMTAAVRVGKAGGELVYKHGAAGAYASGAPFPAAPATTGEDDD